MYPRCLYRYQMPKSAMPSQERSPISSRMEKAYSWSSCRRAASTWRLRYVFGGKEKLLALGVYPGIMLADARERRTERGKLLVAGTDPGHAKKESKRSGVLKSENTFGAVAREWIEKRKHEWAAITIEVKLGRLERYVFPKLGNRPIADITPPEVLGMLRVVEGQKRNSDTRRGG